MNENDFNRRRQDSIAQMREMSAKSQTNSNARKMPPVPPFVKLPENNNNLAAAASFQKDDPPEINPRENAVPYKTGLNIPFSDNLFKDGDFSLILGLLLILMSENADKMLLFALVYILL